MSNPSITKNSGGPVLDPMVTEIPPINLATLNEEEPDDASSSDTAEAASSNPFSRQSNWQAAPSLDAVAARRSVLRAGHVGPAVAALQHELNDRAKAAGLDQIEVDGYFGKDTRRLVREIQETYGLAADGIVGHATLGQLDTLDQVALENSEPLARLNPFVRESGLAVMEDLRQHGPRSQAKAVGSILADDDFSRLTPEVQLAALHRLHHAAENRDQRSFRILTELLKLR